MQGSCNTMAETYVFFTKWYKSLKIPVLESAQTDRLYRQVNGTANPFAKKEEEKKLLSSYLHFCWLNFSHFWRKKKSPFSLLTLLIGKNQWYVKGGGNRISKLERAPFHKIMMMIIMMPKNYADVNDYDDDDDYTVVSAGLGHMCPNPQNGCFRCF